MSGIPRLVALSVGSISGGSPPRGARHTLCVEQNENGLSSVMVHQPHVVAFWCGLALIMIFVDHIPGILYARTLVNFSISDAADVFVFLRQSMSAI
jgi:hypothetical protein